MMKTTIRNLALSALVALSTSSAVALDWTGTGGNLNWSNGANWEFGVPPVAGDIVYFEDAFQSGYTNQAKAVNNIVDANTAVGAMNFTARSFGITNHFYTTLIPGGITLTLGGLGASPRAALVVGDVPGSLSFASANNYTNYSAITGPGSLVVNDPASLISVGWRNRATLDLEGLNTFSANVKQLWVGVSDENPNTTGPTGWLLLAKTNTITTPADLTAPGVLLGHATNTTGNATLLLGQVNNFNTDGFVVGGRRGSSTLQFGSAYSNTPSPGTFTLRGSAGGATPIPVFAIGDSSANPDGYNTAFPGNSAGTSGSANFSGGAVDIRVDSLYIGRASMATNAAASGTGNGTLIVEQGTVNATNVFIAYKPPGSTNATIGRGILFLRSNAVMNVQQDVALVFRTNGTAFIDESIVAVSNNAVLNIGGNLKTVRSTGSWTPAVVRLGGGRINMTGGGEVDVPRITGAGYLTNASSITVTNELTPGTAATADTLVLGNNLTVGAAVKPLFNLGADTTVGGGVNDYIEVAGNVTFNNNPITLDLQSPLVVGTYKLIGYGGSQSGVVTWVNPTRSPIGLVQGAGQVAIVVTNLTPGNLVWQGAGTSSAWDKTALNWNSNTDKFFDLDNVRFDDTGVATNITIATTVTNFPNSIIVSNNSKDYFITQTGNGRISGPGGLTKEGSRTLVMGLGGVANYFTGPVNVNAGTLKLGSFNTGAFGSQDSTQPINIAPGATLDCNGNSIGSAPGRPINVAGNGVDGNGAIGHFNATGSGNPTVTTRELTLTANTKVGAVATKALNFSGPTAPYGGVLNLSGYTLTTAGAGDIRLVQMVATNSGSINVENPVFAIRNSIFEGAGSINIGNNTLSLGGNNAFTTGYVAKAISVGIGSITAPNVNAYNIPLNSPITISNGGGLTVNNSQVIIASGVITGNASLTKLGNSNLVLTAANTYSGPTTVTGGRLALAGAGSLVSPLITVNGAGGFDVTSLAGGYTVTPGQTIQADGTAYGNFTAGTGGTLRGSGFVAGSVTVAPGGTLAAGSLVQGGVLTISTNLTFNGGTNEMKLGGPDDLVVVGGDLSFNAPTVIRVVPVGPLGTHTLFTYTGSLSGTNNIQFVAPRPLVFALDTSTPGIVAVTISGGVTLDWQGGAAGAPTAWDVNTTTNWLNSGSPDVFFGGDAVNFGDTALTNTVNLVASVAPASINFNNSSSPYTLTGAGGITAGGLTTSGGADVTLQNSGNVTLTGRGLGLNAGTLTFNQPTNTTLTAKISGFTGMAKAGTSTLTVVSADSSNFFGTVTVNAGTVRLGSLNALGDSSVTIASGGTLDVNGQASDLAAVQVGGVGADGLGAINNRGGQQTNALNNVTLTADTVLGAFSNRWDVAPLDTNGTPGLFAGNNYKLTKTGTNDLWIRPLSDTGVGDIDIQGGRLVFAGAGTLLGNTSSNIVVRTNAALGFAAGVQDPGKPTVIDAGGSLYSSGSTNLFGGPIVMSNGLVRLESNTRLELPGNLSGPAKLTVQGVNAGNFGTLVLSGSNTYTGGTLVNDGQLVIAASNAIPANTNIVLNSRVPYNNSGHPLVTIISNVVTPAGVTLEMQTLGSAGAAQAGLSGNGGTWAGPILITGNQNNCRVNFDSGYGGLTIGGAVNATGFTADQSLGGSGGVVLGGDNVVVADPTFSGVGLRFNRPLQLTGSATINNTGLGGSPGMTKLVLATNGNSWSILYLTRGVIQIEADNALPLAPVEIGTLQAGADHRVVLDLNGHNQTLVDWRERFIFGDTGPGNDQAWFGNSSTNANSILTYASTKTNAWTAYIIDAFDTNAVVKRQTALTVSSGYLRLLQGTDPTNNTFGAFASGPAPYPFTNDYSGPTTVSGGILRVDSVVLNSPVTVSGTGTLTGRGTLGAGVAVVAGGTIAPGTNFVPGLAPGAGIATLTVSNNLSLGGNCVMEINPTTATNDRIVGISTVTYGGTLTVTNVGGPLVAGNTFTLFSASSYGGNFATLAFRTPGQFVTWNTNNLAVNGSITVASVTSSTPPVITNSISGGSLTMTWPSQNTGWQLQSQTNSLSTGISPTWYPVAGSSTTNSVTVPIVPSNPTVFYRLVYP